MITSVNSEKHGTIFRCEMSCKYKVVAIAKPVATFKRKELRLRISHYFPELRKDNLNTDISFCHEESYIYQRVAMYWVYLFLSWNYMDIIIVHKTFK